MEEENQLMDSNGNTNFKFNIKLIRNDVPFAKPKPKPPKGLYEQLGKGNRTSYGNNISLKDIEQALKMVYGNKNVKRITT